MCPLCCCINSIKYSRKHFSDVSSLSCDRSFKRHYTSSNEVHIFLTLFILHFITCSSTAHVSEFNLQIFFFLVKFSYDDDKTHIRYVVTFVIIPIQFERTVFWDDISISQHPFLSIFASSSCVCVSFHPRNNPL